MSECGNSVSILIVARNAERTIGAAVQSATNEPVDEVLLIDDRSDDRTVEIAEGVGDARLRVVSLSEHSTLGAARNRGLVELKTDFCFLLDADDELLPGRVRRLQGIFGRDGIDVIADEVELWDGETDREIGRLRIPSFLFDAPGLARLFERNYLPGIGQIGFRVSVFKKLGYDTGLHGTEDSNIALRSLLAGARWHLEPTAGYKMKHYERSTSRDLPRQRCELARSLERISYDDVYGYARREKASERLACWLLASMAFYRNEWAVGGRYLDRIEELGGREELSDVDLIAWGSSEKWRMAFFRGVASYNENSLDDAQRFFEKAMQLDARPEVLNNLGLVRRGQGKELEAIALLGEALERRKDYWDASRNCSSESRRELTTHPFRVELSRSSYEL